MKTRALSGFVAATAFLAAFSGAQAPQEETKDRLLRVTQILIGQPDAALTREKFTEAIIELLDIAAAITPDNQYRKDIRYRIDVAKDLIKKDSLFNDKARQYLSFAYRQMTNGVRFEAPKELREFVTPAEFQEKSLKYLKGLVDNARTSLAAGKTADTAKALLEIALMIMTPVTG
jgi:hypothetical protein